MGNDRDDDRRLAARAGAGDERAFAELVDRHREPLLRYIARRFSPELAEDAVQEALLSAHRALTSGTAPADVRAWLSTIAWRRALDMTRRERESLPLDADVAAASAHEPEARLIQSTELGRVVAAFSELPERQRRALTLSALEGRSLEEIGDVLDVAPDAAKSLVARSRRTLTHRLAAADLCCEEVRVQMEDAAVRGVRLPGDVTLHLRECRSCTRAHREIRRRRRLRVALVIPFGLAVRTASLRDRLRDLIAFNPAWEAQASAAKLCTAACLTAVGAGSAAAPAVVVLPPRATPYAVALVAPVHKPAKKKRKPHRPRPKPTATATPTATIAVARATPTPTPKPKVVVKYKAPRPKIKPSPIVAGAGESAPTLRRVDATPTPTAVETPAALAG
jgi:RNA polymerase sigma-70 factor (ECF subfamily)